MRYVNSNTFGKGEIMRTRTLGVVVLGTAMATTSLARPSLAEVKVTKVTYMNQPNCYKLSNGRVEVIVTTNIGPRIIRYGFVGGENILGEHPAAAVKTTLGTWKPWGGHRLWTAPEAMPRSYSPDNSPIKFKLEGKNTIRLTQPTEPKTGFQKEMVVTLDPGGSHVRVLHRLTNRNQRTINIAPWALTIMNGNGGGTAIIPQEPYRAHSAYLLPARPMVFWHYTDLSDPRWRIGKKYIRLRAVPTRTTPQKVGVMNKQGWAAYHRRNTLFVKRYPHKAGASYPDYGCNTETFTNGNFIEVETLGHLENLQPSATSEHIEHWHLFRNVSIGNSEASLDRVIKPLLARTAAP